MTTIDTRQYHESVLWYHREVRHASDRTCKIRATEAVNTAVLRCMNAGLPIEQSQAYIDGLRDQVVLDMAAALRRRADTALWFFQVGDYPKERPVA